MFGIPHVNAADSINGVDLRLADVILSQLPADTRDAAYVSDADQLPFLTLTSLHASLPPDAGCQFAQFAPLWGIWACVFVGGKKEDPIYLSRFVGGAYSGAGRILSDPLNTVTRRWAANRSGSIRGIERGDPFKAVT